MPDNTETITSVTYIDIDRDLTVDVSKITLSALERKRFDGVLDVMVKQQTATMANMQLQAIQEATWRGGVEILNNRIELLTKEARRLRDENIALKAEVAALKTAG